MTDDSSWSATADRVEQIIDTLTRHGVAVDRDTAARAVAHCRRRAAGGKEELEAEAEMDEFLHAHGQSLDWAYLGNPAVMIAMLAAAHWRRW
jgi:hypothetical protein